MGKPERRTLTEKFKQEAVRLTEPAAEDALVRLLAGRDRTMKRFLLLGCSTILAGCATTPYEPNFKSVLPGNYQAVANCYYLKNPSGFQKVDTPSTKTSSIIARTDGLSPQRIDFIATAENLTEVRAQLGPAANAGDWHKNGLATLRECSDG